MKRWTVLLAAAVMAFAGTLYAQERAAAPGGAWTVQPREAAPNAPGGRGAPGAQSYIDNIDKVVTLTDDQKQQMTDIIAARDKAMSDFSAKNDAKILAASQALTNAYKAQDNAAITQATADYQALYAPVQEIMKKSSDQLNKVLTREQTAKLQDSRATAYIQMIAGAAKLTPDQLKQLKAAFAQGDGNNYQATNSLLQEILTPEQKTAIAAGQAVSYVKAAFYQAKLTPDQLKQVEAISSKLAKDDTLQPGELYQKLTEQTNALLTDEQKTAMKNAPQWGIGGTAPKTGAAQIGEPLNPPQSR